MAHVGVLAAPPEDWSDPGGEVVTGEAAAKVPLVPEPPVTSLPTSVSGEPPGSGTPG